MPSSSLDLTPGLDITIKPLHPSVLGQENCFQVQRERERETETETETEVGEGGVRTRGEWMKEV